MRLQRDDVIPHAVIAVPKRLRYLAGCYFHPDYDLDFSGPDALVAGFAKAESAETVHELVSEIDVLLASTLSESELADLWLEELDAFYDPRDDGQT